MGAIETWVISGDTGSTEPGDGPTTGIVIGPRGDGR